MSTNPWTDAEIIDTVNLDMNLVRKHEVLEAARERRLKTFEDIARPLEAAAWEALCKFHAADQAEYLAARAMYDAVVAAYAAVREQVTQGKIIP